MKNEYSETDEETNNFTFLEYRIVAVHGSSWRPVLKVVLERFGGERVWTPACSEW